MKWPYGRVGYVLAGEEHSGLDLVGFGQAAEKAGFGFLFLSDHFHPWNFHQAHSSYIWSVLGALATTTRKIGLVSAVTCPILRLHPTTLAQAASTVYHLSQGRFVLGLGTGEALNERVVGQGFPDFEERLARLLESVEHTRALLTGDEVSIEGIHFTTERARLFDSAPELPIYFACSGRRTVGAAAEFADGVVTLGPRREILEGLAPGQPRLAQLSVCWAASVEEGASTAHHYFPEVAMDGLEFTRLTTPEEFSRAATKVSVSDVEASIVCGPDPSRYRELIQHCFEQGYDGVALHQIGPDQAGFLRFCSESLSLKV